MGEFCDCDNARTLSASPVIQDDERLLTVLRYIEANPLRAGIVERAEEYPWNSYRAHGLGETNELVAALITYEDLSPYPAVRQRKWSKLVHRPLEEQALAAIRLWCHLVDRRRSDRS